MCLWRICFFFNYKYNLKDNISTYYLNATQYGNLPFRLTCSELKEHRQLSYVKKHGTYVFVREKENMVAYNVD